jgi:hypothetical protein
MTIGGPGPSTSGLEASNTYGVSVARLAQNQARADGEAAVALIDGVPSAPPVGPHGQGQVINTHA